MIVINLVSNSPKMPNLELFTHAQLRAYLRSL